MPTLQIEPELPLITSTQSLDGWHREFCVELFGEGKSRLFVRAVEQGSSKATEQQKGTLFHRLHSRFVNLEEYIKAHHKDLERLTSSARRPHPTKDNLFVTLQFDSTAWERVRQSLDCWRR